MPLGTTIFLSTRQDPGAAYIRAHAVPETLAARPTAAASTATFHNALARMFVPPLSSEPKCNTPADLIIGTVDQDLRECCHAMLFAFVG